MSIPVGEQPETVMMLEAARAGDHEAVERLIGPHRRELQVHCYLTAVPRA